MVINFVGNFANGYVGEVADETHLAREMERLGHKVNRVPRDVWKAYCEGYSPNDDWVMPEFADINIITKWHHFTDGTYIDNLKAISSAPVFYWCWDYMGEGMADWHMSLVKAADLYLGNDVRDPDYRMFSKNNTYYFPFDVADMDVYRGVKDMDKEYDVSFFGSWVGKGDRQEWLKEIVDYINIKVFSWNYDSWPSEFNASPAVYGHDFVRAVKKSKIIIGFNVEPNCWGYWSNRVGKVLLAGGFLLQQYAPGMELFLRDGVEYFSTIDELKEKIDFYLLGDKEREDIAKTGWLIGQDRFSSRERVKDLMILTDRYLQNNEGWML